MPIHVNVDQKIAERRMTIAEFVTAIGITPANVSVLKNGRARAIRFTTFDASCRVRECQPGDVLSYVPEEGGGVTDLDSPSPELIR